MGLVALKEDGYVYFYNRPSRRIDIPSRYRLFESYDKYMKEKLAAEEERKQREKNERLS